jgi:hypothetical protein
MTAGPQNPEKGTENVRRARIGSETGTVVGTEKETGTRTGRGTVTGVSGTRTVTATTGSAVSEVNTVIALMTDRDWHRSRDSER